MILTGEAIPKGPEEFGRRVEVLKKPAAPEDFIAAIERLSFKDLRPLAEEE
jgi:hypothetical protein